MELANVYHSAVDGRYYKTNRGAEMAKIFEGEAIKFEAGIVTPGDIADVKAVTILDEMLGLARPLYTLRKMCRSVAMNKLAMRVDVATALAGQEKVAPMVEAEISKEAYSKVDFDLWKNVVHIAVADESELRTSHALLAISTQDAAADLVRMENSQVATIAEACTEKVSGTVYSDWGAKTNNVSDTDPMVAVLKSMSYILGKGYSPSFLAMHPTIWEGFVLNTIIADYVDKGIMRLAETGGSFQLPGYGKMDIIVDHALTEVPTGTIGPLVGAAGKGIFLGLGPTVAAKYRDEKAGYDAYIIRQWLEPKIVIQDALDKICT